LLNNAFGGRYLKGGSWPDRGAFVEHVCTSGLEYSRLYAHRFEWSWTGPKMRAWFARHSTCISGIAFAQRHVSMDPNRYEVSEPELLRGLRLS
jgi:hypothetical protein